MMVRRFLLQCVLLSIPIGLVFGTVAWVDPYGLFGHSGPVPVERKRLNLYHSGRTMAFSNMLWKLIEFQREPAPNILLGDSRLSYFDLDALEQVSGSRYRNLGIPGGNYRTVRDLFHYADSLTHLQKVCVQVSFRGLNQGLDWDLYSEARGVLEKPYTYLYNRRVLEATALNLFSWTFPDRVTYDATPPDQWQRVLVAERANAQDFHPDTTVYRSLRELAARCRQHGTELLFVEYPTHPDVQRIYTEAGLGKEREAYLTELRAIAPVIDLDRPGLFSAEADHWRDPLHLTTTAQRELIDRVWGNVRPE